MSCMPLGTPGEIEAGARSGSMSLRLSEAAMWLSSGETSELRTRNVVLVLQQ